MQEKNRDYRYNSGHVHTYITAIYRDQRLMILFLLVAHTVT